MQIKDIEKIQNVLKHEMRTSLKRKNLQKTIELIDAYADATQRVNNILRDDEVENIIENIADLYIDQSADIFNGDEKSVVFYDQIGTCICLALQYLRALSFNGYKITYIYESSIHAVNPRLIEEIKDICYTLQIFDTKNVYCSNKFVANDIRDIILKANPSKIIVHQEATGALAMSVLYSIRGATKYKIIPGDHHFYLGFKCFDYFLEFRRFGWSTAVYERHIPADKIYNMPYYPLIDEFVAFQGFPFNRNNKVVIGAGGASYKFQGSTLFYSLLERILENSDNAVFVFIGVPTEQMKELSQQEKMKSKIFLLGYRRDFSSLIKNIDILINSYPFSGGLFCQTAAYHNKPILSFSNESYFIENCVDDLLGKPDINNLITFTSKTDFISEAMKLIADEQYRKERGQKNHDMLTTKYEFDERLDLILSGKCESIADLQIEYIDRSCRIDNYLKINNQEEPTVLLFPSKILGVSIFWKFSFLKKDLLRHFKYIVIHILSYYSILQKIKHKSLVLM